MINYPIRSRQRFCEVKIVILFSNVLSLACTCCSGVVWYICICEFE